MKILSEKIPHQEKHIFLGNASVLHVTTAIPTNACVVFAISWSITVSNAYQMINFYIYLHFFATISRFKWKRRPFFKLNHPPFCFFFPTLAHLFARESVVFLYYKIFNIQQRTFTYKRKENSQAHNFYKTKENEVYEKIWDFCIFLVFRNLVFLYFVLKILLFSFYLSVKRSFVISNCAFPCI